MKFILLVIIGALLWNNNQARQFTSDSLQQASDFIQPEQQRQIKLSFWIMNTFTITIELSTYSDSPEDWITESIIEQLEDGEELNSITIQQSSIKWHKLKNNNSKNGYNHVP